jgi:lipopolysaccharide transport system permease protein
MRFKNTYLGFLWIGLEPLLYFSVLYVVFTTIRNVKGDFPIYLITGIMIYHIFTRGTTGGLGSLLSNSGIIKSININKEFFPVVSTTAVMILSIVTIGIFFGLMPIFQFVPTYTIFYLPIILPLLFILVLGFSYLLSVVNILVRDIQHIWTILTLGLLFVSPIFWYLDETKGVLLEIQKINPVGQLIEIAHQLVVFGKIPPLQDWLYTTLLVFVVFTIGFIVFKTFEHKIVEEL